MLANVYQNKCQRTWNDSLTERDGVFNATLGLTGEAGEVADLIKKAAFHGHETDADKVAKELGDVCYYVAILASYYGFELSDIFEMNVTKLKARYPNGFSNEASALRQG